MKTAEREFEGKDLADAVRAASEALGLAPDAIRYAVVDEGRRGLFGVGSRRIRIRVQEGASNGDETETGPPDGADPATEVETSIRRLVGLMGLDLTVRGQGEDGSVRILLDGPHRDLLTQRDGELLAALQFLVQRMARRTWPGAGHIVVECEGYRDRREEEIGELAREVARQVERTGRPRKLPAMNPYERRVVHLTVREFPSVTSRSSGEGFLKQVTVSPASRPEQG